MSLTAEPRLRARGRRSRRAPRTQFDKFPRDPIARWSLRVALMLPVLAVVLIIAESPALEGTPNRSLEAGLAQIDWTRGDGEWLALLYPHVSILIAAANPIGMLGLGLVAAVASGFLLQTVVEIAVQRSVPPATVVLLTLALAGNPLYLYLAAENVAGFLAVTFFALAMTCLVRFVDWGSTESGFRAGLLLLLSALSDPSGILFAAVAIAVSPFLRAGPSSAPGLRAANMLVIGFPTVGAFATIALLNLTFFGSPWPAGAAAAIGAHPVSAAELIDLYTTPSGWLLAAHVVAVGLVAVAVRRPRAIVLSALVFALVNAALLLGMIHPGAAGTTYLLLTLLAIVIIPAVRSPFSTVVVNLIAVLQIAIAWAIAADQAIVSEWISRLAEATRLGLG